MKTKRLAAVLVILALWLSYVLGYHRGAEHEERAWESTVEFDADNARHSPHLYFRNPHDGLIVSAYPGIIVNVPDPRNLPWK